MMSQTAAMASIFALLLHVCSGQCLPDGTPGTCQVQPEWGSDQDNEAAVMLQVVANRGKLSTQWCAAGVVSKNGEFCCAASCGSCGGSGCGDRPGGSSQCCTGKMDQTCSHSNEVGCKMPSEESTEWCADGVLSNNGEFCCAASCGSCGGSGCKDRPGGSAQCCTGKMDQTCSDAHDVACKVPSGAPTPAPTPAPTTTVAPTPTPNWTPGCEWLSDDDCQQEDYYACQCRASNPAGPCTNCPDSVPCDTSACDGAQGTSRLTCLQDKKAECCMQSKCHGCSGTACLSCHDDQRAKCCQGYSPAVPACQAPTPAPTPPAARECDIPAGDRCCNPYANQWCPGPHGQVRCPDCGTIACACP